MSCCSKLKCSEVCDCIFFRSTDNSIIVNKEGCIWDVRFDLSLIPEQQIINDLTFDSTTRELCSTVNGIESCVVIPNDDEYLELDGTTLSLYNSDDELLSAIDLSPILEQIPFAATSSSLVITAGGTLGHTPNIEIVPSSDSNNSLILGTDGRPYVAQSTQNPVVGNDTNTVDITISGINNNIVTADLKYESSNSIELSDSTSGLTANLNIDPTSTADISITVDGLKVNSTNVNINNIQGLSFTKSVVGNTITFTPQLDFVYIASQVCALCPPPDTPCNAPTVTISTITDGTMVIGVSPLAGGDTYDVSIDGGISWLVTGATAISTTLTGLTELTTYSIVVRLYCSTGGNVETTPQSAITLDCADITNLAVSMVTSTTATANLTWTPVGFMTNQVPGYKLSSAGSYTTVTATTGNTASITGLLNNTLYDFRVNTACNAPNGSTSNIIQQISLQCPTSTTVGVASDTSINYSFPNYAGTSISNVKVDLLGATGTTIIQTQNKVPPLNSGTFTGLNPLTSYRVRITLQAQGTSQLFQTTCNPSATVTTSGTIYARLDYEVTGSGTCEVNTQDSGFRYVNAIWRTFSNSAGTIPVTPPAGTIINYDRIRRRTVCNCPGNLTTTLDSVQNYNLTLSSNATLVPDSQKYSSGLDWFYCQSIPSGVPCTGTGFLCVQNNMINTFHEIDINSATSAGTVTVVII